MAQFLKVRIDELAPGGDIVVVEGNGMLHIKRLSTDGTTNSPLAKKQIADIIKKYKGISVDHNMIEGLDGIALGRDVTLTLH